MTEQQRKAIEILNNIKNEQKLDGEQIINDDDYFFLLSFIIDKSQEITVAPCPAFPQFHTLTPYYDQQLEVTSKVDDNVRNEQNPTDFANKPETNFHEGEWVVSPMGVYWHIDAIRDGRYQVSSNSGVSTDWQLDTYIYHRFTIADAEEGDVLAVSWWEDKNLWEKIIIFKKYHSEGVEGLCKMPCVEGYGNTFKNGKIAFTEKVPYYSKTWTCNLHPASKEQRDLLFAKMKDAGYVWDDEKKKLRIYRKT